MSNISIALHGGAGTILKSSMTAEKEAEYTLALEKALDEGFDILDKGGSSLDAVEATVILLEDSPLFNAGKGSVFTATGMHEMDASIMNGLDMKAGAIALVSRVKNPIQLARKVMEESDHVFLAGEGAMAFAKDRGVQFMEESYFYDEFRHQQWIAIKDTEKFQLDHSVNKENKFGTVGAVALDRQGNLAAATSTGGMTNKRFGRIGDSSIIGSGTYANNATCAVSCTGSGEYFIRGVVAYDVSCLMEYKGYSLHDACKTVVQERLLKIGGDGGLVACDEEGNLALEFNTEGMYRAQRTNKGVKQVAIYT